MHCMTMNVSSRRELQTVLALLPSTQFSDDFPFLDQLRMFAGPPLGVALGPSGLPILFLASQRFQERGWRRIYMVKGNNVRLEEGLY